MSLWIETPEGAPVFSVITAGVAWEGVNGALTPLTPSAVQEELWAEA